LCGYSKDNQIPEYRIDQSGALFYSGINGSFQVKKLPLPESFISKEYREKIRDSQIHLNIRSLEEIQRSGDGLTRNLTYLAGDVEDNTGITCTSIWQVYDSVIIDKILSNIKSKLLSILLKLEEAYGVLDELDIDTSKSAKDVNNEISTSILQIIFEDNRIKMGDKNKLNKSSISNRSRRKD
jgi:DNA polymerase III delta prime subunit